LPKPEVFGENRMINWS